MNFIAAFMVIVGYFTVIRCPRRMAGYLISTLGCLTYIGLFAGVDWSVVLVNVVFVTANIYGISKIFSDDV